MADPAAVATSETRAEPWLASPTGWYAVAVLTLAYTLAYVDRAILTIIVEPIQADLHINDTQVALLHGFAFVIFYVSLGIPLGYLADRGNRKWLIVGSIGLWSVMTAACGLTRSFGQLFTARIGVGVGEAGLSPASYSVIADYFPPEKRTAAMGVYTLGIYLGSGLAIIGGGAVVALIGAAPFVTLPILGVIRSWQVVFLVVGAPGLLVALIATTMREPARRLTVKDVETRSLFEEWAQAWKQIVRQPAAYGLHTLGFAFLGVPFNVTLLWARPFLSRHFGLSPSHAAYLAGGLMLVFASAGITIGSRITDRLQPTTGGDATIRIGLVAALAILVPVVLLPFMPTLTLAVADLALVLFFGAFAYGAAPAALQLITPNRMRAMISAIYLVLVNLIGLVAGPVTTGALTDYVFRDHEKVGYSAAIVCAVSVLIAALAFAALLKPFRAAASALAR